MKPKVKTIIMTCSISPSQWVGKTENGSDLYIRYRWGGLSVDVNDIEILYADCGHGYDGEMTTARMMGLTKDVLDWSEAEVEG
ncbi:MAG: hypothetical protein P4L67_04420 [Candidatus Pacebacteria bacterium]|nr:hypothetical protein [Candidatus Paceibacterota bacterium]